MTYALDIYLLWDAEPKQLYVVSTDESLHSPGAVLRLLRAKKAQFCLGAVLFLHWRLGFAADFIVGSANAERIHSVFQHATANS